MTAAPGRAGGRPAGAAGAGGGPLVALVNDDRRLIEVAGDLLRRGGFRAVGLALDDEAHARLCRERPDLVVLALTQARPDAGWQLLTLARLDGRLAGVPFVLCSPDGRMLAERAAWLRGMGCDVLVEPFTASALLAKVEAAFATIAVWHTGD